MGAGGFHGRVRDGIGWGLPAMTTRSSSLSVSARGPGVRTRLTGLIPDDWGWGFWCVFPGGLTPVSRDLLCAVPVPAKAGISEDDFHAWCVGGFGAADSDFELFWAIRTS